MKRVRSLPLLIAALVAVACNIQDDPTVPAAAPTATEATTQQEQEGYAFVDVTAERGLALEDRRSWGVAWVDYDRDDDPDLLVNRHFFPPFLFDNSGGDYEHAAWEPTLQEAKFDRHACIWGDPNADELPDLLCTQGAERGKGMGPNQLLIQHADGSFTDEAAAVGVAYPEGRTRSANWVDYDSDGDLDLFLATQLRRGYPNRMYRNDNGSFSRVSVGLEHELETEVSAWADWDRDGDLDLLLTLKNANAVAYENRGGRFRRIHIPRVTSTDWLGAAFGTFDRDRWPDLHLINEGRSLVLHNRRGTFEPVHKTRTRQGRMGVWFDVDNDADQDLFVVRGAPGNGDDPDAVDTPDLLLVREGTGFRKRVIREPGIPTGNGDSAAVADHDRDGMLDLYVTNGYKRSAGPFLLLENQSAGENWAAVRLDGGPGDPFGMWARVRVRAGERVYWRHLSDGLVFRSQSEIGYTHLGLGAATQARVKVVWFDGSRDCATVAAVGTAEIEKGAASCNQTP